LRRGKPHHIGLDARVVGDLSAGSHIDHGVSESAPSQASF
jgi:hypothetical protein